MVSTKKNRFIQILLKNLLAWFASLLVLVPLALIVINAFKGDGEAITMTMQLPKTWQFSNFATVIEKGKLVRSFLNSLLYAGVSTILTELLTHDSVQLFCLFYFEHTFTVRRVAHNYSVPDIVEVSDILLFCKEL